jgi:glycosyltransferase involved in cell wall biosynthesis
MDVSVIVPLYNEEESLPELSEWIDRVCKEANLSYEIVFVDDGSTDTSWSVVEELIQKNPDLKGIKFRRNYGKSAALNQGFEAASGDVVITMDADLQDSPDEIPELYRMIKEEGYDLVSGWKKKRHDPLGKTLPSKFFNRTTRAISGIKLHDFNCGLKAYRNNVVKNVEVYGEMHRYIPVIAKWAGFKNIGEKVVEHRARKYGVTKFGMERLIKGYLDLLSITFISKFGKRPMHLFGTLGTLLFFIGFGIGIYLTVEKYFFEVYKMTERPLFYLGLLAMVMGSQLFVTGFLAEMISRNSTDRNVYQVEKEIGF